MRTLRAIGLARKQQRDEWTPVAGARVYAAVWGEDSQPTVVCVHGLGASHRYFLPFAAAMAGRAQVVAPDLPGFGRTPGPSEALDVAGLSRALAGWLRATARGGSVVVANSMGCQVVVDLATHAPELLGPLVLNAPTTDASMRTARQQASRLLADVPLEGPWLPVVLARDYLACGPRRFARTLQAMLDDQVASKLVAVGSPAVVVRGSLDPVVSRRWAQRVAAGLPRGCYVELPRSGHALNWSRPERLASVVGPLMATES